MVITMGISHPALLHRPPDLHRLLKLHQTLYACVSWGGGNVRWAVEMVT